MSKNTIHLVGYGSQGSAWAQCLKTSGWQVHVYVSRHGNSYQNAIEHGFQPALIQELPAQLSDKTQTHWVAMLCPDTSIPAIYGDFIASSPSNVRLILAHGYAIYSDELKFKNPDHRAILLAPKAIGPKLLQNFQNSFPHPHQLVAAFSALPDDSEMLLQIAQGLGFDQRRLVLASFDQETMGDLISEQGLLCGGVFNLLAWTMEAMAQAGIPDALIREECLTELELIAGVIRERGPAQAFQSISQAAQCGTIEIAKRLDESHFKEHFTRQVKRIVERKFPADFRSQNWREPALNLTRELAHWEQRFKTPEK
jgi:ketol-acid reductoisomerase